MAGGRAVAPVGEQQVLLLVSAQVHEFVLFHAQLVQLEAQQLAQA